MPMLAAYTSGSPGSGISGNFLFGRPPGLHIAA